MRRRNIILGIICLPFLIAMVYWFSVTKSFDENKWNNSNSTLKSSYTRSDRQKMLRSVLQKIKGKTKAEIIQMLGDGDKVYYLNKSKQDLIYLLGPERNLISIDSEWLLLRFDKNEILDSYEIGTD